NDRLAISSDGRYVAVSDRDRIARIWDLQTGTGRRLIGDWHDPLRSLVGRWLHSKKPTLLQRLAYRWVYNSLGWYRPAPWAAMLRDWLLIYEWEPLPALAFSADGRRLILGNKTEVRVLDVRTGKTTQVIPAPCDKAAISADGRNVALVQHLVLR